MKLIKYFIQSAGGLLLAAALIRFTIGSGNSYILAMPDPLLGLPLLYSVWLVGGFELIVALICLFGRRPGLQLGWLAWASFNYLGYWIGLVMMPSPPQISCIGSLTDPLQISRGNIGLMLQFVPLYILIGSCVAIVWLWSKGIKSNNERFYKMVCPNCGIHIRFDYRNLGQRTSCLQCRTTITLRKPDLLKMACFFCQEHIEFPTHALGKKISCPHCKMDITLKESA